LIHYVVDYAPAIVDPLHGTVDLFHEIFSRKIIQ
jgi:hypothetical protein